MNIWGFSIQFAACNFIAIKENIIKGLFCCAVLSLF